MMNPNKENTYMCLIGLCKKEVEEIKQILTIITQTSPIKASGNSQTPSRTILEGELQNLLSSLQELREDIQI